MTRSSERPGVSPAGKAGAGVVDRVVLPVSLLALSVLYGFAFVFEIGRDHGAATGPVALWMAPVLMLSLVFTLGFILSLRLTRGANFERNTWRVILAISAGAGLAAAAEGAMLSFLLPQYPGLEEIGDKRRLLLLALFGMSWIISLLAGTMRQATAIKEENDQFV